MTHSLQNRTAGITLVEILIAIVVLSIAFIGSFTAISQYIKNTDGLRERTFAHWSALNVIETMRLEGTPALGESEQVVEMGLGKWRIVVLVEPAPLDLRRIEVRSSPMSTNNKKRPVGSSAVLVTYFKATP